MKEKYVIIITDKDGREDRIKEIIQERSNEIYAVVLRSVENVESASKKLKSFCKKHNVLLLTHSNHENIKYCDGIHLNSKSKSITDIRKEYGSDLIIGYSSHSVDEAKKALSDGANYVFLSPVFNSKYTGVKPIGVEAFNEAVDEIGQGVFALGGVDKSNFRLLSIKTSGYAASGDFFSL